jgi:CheY-like chemotaxis protein
MNMAVSTESKTILLVDDEDYLQIFLKTLLIGEGYKVILASNGNEAVETYKDRQTEIDLILMDINMPIKDGFESQKEISQFDPHVPVVLMSGNSYEELKDLDHVKFIRKPMYPLELFKTLQEVFQSIIPAPLQGGYL